jgi:hypothetical protein
LQVIEQLEAPEVADTTDTPEAPAADPAAWQLAPVSPLRVDQDGVMLKLRRADRRIIRNDNPRMRAEIAPRVPGMVWDALRHDAAFIRYHETVAGLAAAEAELKRLEGLGYHPEEGKIGAASGRVVALRKALEQARVERDRAFDRALHDTLTTLRAEKNEELEQGLAELLDLIAPRLDRLTFLALSIPAVNLSMEWACKLRHYKDRLPDGEDPAE